MKDILLIVHIEIGDEIHFDAIPYSFKDELMKLVVEEKIEQAIELVYDNVLSRTMIQSCCVESWNDIYNIVEIYNFSELGC